MANPQNQADDIRWMKRALGLAARGFTPPNPMVGCVLVKNNTVVGEGYHLTAGMPHAEVVAINHAGARARGATAYITLEPCSHFGRTPPCVEALIAAGVSRVVAAVEDPNPAVQGRGIEAIRAAGVDVVSGVLETEARKLNEAFFHFHATGMPYVTLKAAVSLDGKIATRTGDSKWITGERARRLAHRLRAQSGAVLCGIGTVLKDDPLMTARFAQCPRQPLRVVLDSNLRLPAKSRIAQTAADYQTMAVTSCTADASRVRELERLGVEILQIPADTRGQVALHPMLEALGQRGIINVLVEGGGEVHASFLEACEAQRLLWFIAPKIIGGAVAPTSVEGRGASLVSAALSLEPFRLKRVGVDLLIESYLISGSKQ